MPNVPSFFVPAADSPEQAEKVYADFAKMCRKSVLPLHERIYSITYRHNGEEWTATVGETLSGHKYQMKTIGGMKTEVSTPVSDPALVLAIFPGDPFFVVTHHRLVGDVGSKWENPFMAGRPGHVVLFSPADCEG